MLAQGGNEQEKSAAMRLLVTIIIGYLRKPRRPMTEAEEELYERMSSW